MTKKTPAITSMKLSITKEIELALQESYRKKNKKRSVIRRSSLPSGKKQKQYVFGRRNGERQIRDWIAKATPQELQEQIPPKLLYTQGGELNVNHCNQQTQPRTILLSQNQQRIRGLLQGIKNNTNKHGSGYIRTKRDRRLFSISKDIEEILINRDKYVL